MEQPQESRRKASKPKVENYYKVLGLRASATQAAIKQKYIELVKAFPPETHPVEFQQVRRAYETLRDPVKRSEYDLLRKYGGKIEKLMDDALEQLEAGNFVKAEKLCRQAVALLPEDFNIRVVLAQILLWQGDYAGCEEQFQFAFDRAPEQEKPLILRYKARLLVNDKRPKEALAVLEQVKKMYPEVLDNLVGLYTEVYLCLGMTEEAWSLAESHLPDASSQDPEDIFKFIHYLNVMFTLGKWSVWSNVLVRVRKFLKTVSDPDDKLMVQTALLSEHDDYFDLGRFREAETYIDLAYYVDPRNQEVREQRTETLELRRVQKELDRMKSDERLFPVVGLQAFKWFCAEFMEEDDISSILEQVPLALMEQMEGMDEEYAAGILYLRKRYPLVYGRYRDRWDLLFKEKTAHLNREARRRLR